MKLNITENDENQSSYALAKLQLEQFHQTCLMEKNESSRRTILKNTSRANQLYHELGESKQSFLFLINRSTEFLGQHIDTDFVLLSFIIDAPDIQMLETKSESKSTLANTIKSAELAELEQEKQELESRLKEATNEITELTNAQET